MAVSSSPTTLRTHFPFHTSLSLPSHRPTSLSFPRLSLIHRHLIVVATSFHGKCYVVGYNIDMDQIIPAEYLTLIPSNPEEYTKLGSYALIGLPEESYKTRFVKSGENMSEFSIVIAVDNFGCGSSREHILVALGAAGVTAVVAESYARIFPAI